MTNFQDAFRKGLDAAKRSGAAQREIDDVFAKLQEQIKNATDNRIEIYKRERKSFSHVTISLTMKFEEHEENTGKDENLVIVARNPKSDPNLEKIIARLNISNIGYPCVVSWGKIQRTCHDRKSLELCLSSLLEDANTAEILGILLNLPDATKTTSSQEG